MLARPTVFNAYVGCSAGWFAEDNDYFSTLRTRAFQAPGSFASRRVFMSTYSAISSGWETFGVGSTSDPGFTSSGLQRWQILKQFRRNCA